MPDNRIVQITGIDEVCEFFDTLPALICSHAMSEALHAGIDVIETAVVDVTPVQVFGPLEQGETRLREAAMTDVVVDSRGRGGIASMGFGKEGHKANWVEYGHRMVGHKPGKADLGEVPPHPFMRPAFEASADAAIEAFTDSLTDSVNKGLKP